MRPPWQQFDFTLRVRANFDPTGLSEAAIIASIAGTAVSAGGAIMYGIQASQSANYNAAVARNNATAAVQQSELAAQQQQKQATVALGAIRAGYGAAGVVSTEGSPIDVLASSAMNAEQDRQTILYKGQLQASGYADEAALEAARAGNAIPNGIGSAFGIASSGATRTLTMIGKSPGAGL